jgi:hypothetical protein
MTFHAVPFFRARFEERCALPRPPRPRRVNTLLRNADSHGINNHVESSVWLVGRVCATLVARPASNDLDNNL